MREDPKHSASAHAIIKRVEQGEEAAISSLVIAQICGYLKWRKRSDLIPIFLSFLESLSSLTKIETTFSDLAVLNDLAQESKKKGNNAWTWWDDLVIATQMRRLGLTEIYSNDSDFDTMPGITRIFN
jgi:predicted nucleic acid-binding protein